MLFQACKVISLPLTDPFVGIESATKIGNVKKAFRVYSIWHH